LCRLQPAKHYYKQAYLNITGEFACSLVESTDKNSAQLPHCNLRYSELPAAVQTCMGLLTTGEEDMNLLEHVQHRQQA